MKMLIIYRSRKVKYETNGIRFDITNLYAADVSSNVTETVTRSKTKSALMKKCGNIVRMENIAIGIRMFTT